MSNLKKTLIKGFTLIELMIVVAIIGILAAVAIPKFADLVTKSKEAATKGTLGSLRSAVSIYYGDNEGVYPLNLFVSLTNGNKYLPGVSGLASLGKYSLPKNGSTGFTGHEGGLFANANGAAAVNQTAIVPDETVTGPLYYNSNTGDSLINCSHQDSKAVGWSTY